MEIIHKIKMDLVRQGITPRIPVVQGDAFSRKLTVSLFADRKPWKIPPDASAVIRYLKPDHTSGSYDTLADGTSAASVSGNNISILVAPEALTLAGPVALMVTILRGQTRLSTFAIGLDVQSDCTSGLTDEEGAAWIAAFLPSPEGAAPGQYLAVNTVDETGHVLSVTAEDFPGVTAETLQAELDAYMQEHGVVDGQDGVSVTHEWEGTVLKVTSASGTSSADLKGEKGDTGPQGENGDAGAAGQDGLTPFIGENGNWWIGDTDTTVSASGKKYTEFLEEQVITEYTTINEFTSATLNVELNLVAGATYIVTWDGVEYNCTCIASATSNSGSLKFPYLGDAGIFLPDYPRTGEPFLILPGDSSTAVFVDDGAESHTLAIRPASVAGLPTVTANDDGKFLRVVEGAWAAVAVDAAEEANF